MNIKKIEAYGFKSFADKLSLEFEKGVTCIVGPNGCGKSNVSDAIKWVLGEQSSKALRGTSMKDVIFKGTQARKPMGYCEVSLFFDNTTRTYDINADELIITRKLYKSGESEYLINRQNARLKDIIDLFRDTGIGKDGYSVVGQGKITQFLNAKPEDRRQIFEEAAGISKYKANRLIAQRKLDSTDSYLENINFKLGTLEERIAPLTKQAEDTLKARELKERIKTIEINSYLHLLETSESERSEYKNQIASIDNRLKQATTNRDQASLSYQSAQSQKYNIDNRYKELTDERLVLTIELTNQDNDKNTLTKELEQSKERITKLTTEIDEKSKSINTNNQIISDNNENLQKTLRLYNDENIKSKEMEERCIRLDERVTEQRNQIDTINQLMLNSADKITTISVSVVKLKTEIDNLNKITTESKEAISQKKTSLNNLIKESNQYDKEIQIRDDERKEKLEIKAESDKIYSAKVDELNELSERHARINESIVSLNSSIKYLEQSKQNYSGFNRAVQFLMSSKDNFVREKVIGVFGEMIQVPTEYSTAIEVALGGNINDIVVNTRADANALVNVLVKSGSGRATFLPMEAMRPRALEDKYLDCLDEEGCLGIASDLVKFDYRYRRAIDTHLGRIVVAENKEYATNIVRKYPNAFRVVTLDGASYAINGAITGGQTKGEDTRLLSAEKNLAEMKKMLLSKENQGKNFAVEVTAVKETMAKCEQVSNVLALRIQKLDKEIFGLEQSQNFSFNEQKRLNAEINNLTELISNNNLEVHSKTALYNLENSKASDTSSERTGANEMRSGLTDELMKREGEYKKAVEEKNMVLLSIQSLGSKLDEIDRNLRLCEKTIDMLTREILEAKSQLNTTTARQKDIIAELEIKAQLIQGNEKLETVNTQLKELETEKVKLENDIQKFYVAEQKYSEELSSLNVKRARIEGSLQQVEIEINKSSEHVAEEYGLEFDTAKAFKVDAYDYNKGLQELKIVKKDLSKLGNINEQSIEELASVSTDYNELVVQRDDVVKAKESLEETIKDLTAKMQNNFSESFKKIQENFQEVFPLLFGGGHAELSLNIKEGMTVLDAGITIKAEPDGKRLSNIDLLSGGEKALTTIAVIFAIIKLNPMPFCVLDEVDAPLDETNAKKFAQYLQKFSKDTQFILVSHRKPTMELADQLYGITMQEKGVSRSYKLSLKEALKHTEV